MLFNVKWYINTYETGFWVEFNEIIHTTTLKTKSKHLDMLHYFLHCTGGFICVFFCVCVCLCRKQCRFQRSADLDSISIKTIMSILTISRTGSDISYAYLATSKEVHPDPKVIQ